MDTISTRKNIGFPKKKEDWTKNHAVYDKHTLRIANHPVMEDWELGYMQMLAKIACMNKGIVLEVGYGLGLSATAIQNENITSHNIIECHPDVVSKCIKDQYEAIKNNRLHVFTGFWEDITPMIKDCTFDGILFDTYPLTEEEIHANHFWFFKEAYRILKPEGILTYYSDEATGFSEIHLEKLIEAGFSKENIGSKVCDVNPPENCEYWKEKTIMAPIIRK